MFIKQTPSDRMNMPMTWQTARVLTALSTPYVRSRSAAPADVIITHQNAAPGRIAQTVFYSTI